jgi:hypothetical protein
MMAGEDTWWGIGMGEYIHDFQRIVNKDVPVAGDFCYGD